MKVGDRVRATSDGQIGFIVESEPGEGLRVRLDRRGENRVVPYHAHSWVPDVEAPISDMQVARICYEADKAWRICHGEYAQQIPDWISMREQERAKWLSGPVPKPSRKRERLYALVKAAVRASEAHH